MVPSARLIVPSSAWLTPLPAWGAPVTVSGGHAAAHAPVHADVPFLSASNRYRARPPPPTRAVAVADWSASPAAISAAVHRCLAGVTRDPRHDTTTSAVRDLDQVRQALGYDKINIYGVSYGVTMGLACPQRYSSHVRAAVLDSGSLLDVPLWQLAPVHAQQAVDQTAARCAAVPACRSYRAAADLAAAAVGLRAHPARVTIAGPGGQQQTVTLTLPAFLNLVEDYLSSTDTAVLLLADLQAASGTRSSASASPSSPRRSRPRPRCRPSCRKSRSAAATPEPR